MRFILPALLLLFLAAACGEKKKYPSYKEVRDNLYCKMHVFGNKEDSITGEYIKGKFVFTDSTGRKLQQISSLEPLKVNTGKYYECIFDEAVRGDSLTFIFDSLDLPLNDVLPKPIPVSGKTTVSPLRLDVRIMEQMSSEEYREFLHNREMKEHQLLKRYLEEQGIDTSAYYKGVRVIPLEKGHGKKVKPGRVVYMHYRGKFLDHSAFDSTYHMNEPFEFTFGTPGQVIDGLEIGISRLREGDKAKIIIPSQLAFGEKGSSTGIVPPYTTVIYQVELKKVR